MFEGEGGGGGVGAGLHATCSEMTLNTMLFSRDS